jgi:hypothetical protein
MATDHEYFAHCIDIQVAPFRCTFLTLTIRTVSL